ncbi:hypothetical protein PIGHUM_01112 [Pigmentiphaga humi]|uniref:Uroporphyrin-III C-methyltransferase n=1 Tax=Pigmentiphaga humi TaxID=2478468 RepID=A0A3P4AZ69_9BURK|nr:DUF488 family protein [Pigmentiphaga humi]VCU69052.1 hypothetical protein PIGHUM_01112 [Pigmentiphaga humi]
MKSAEQPDIDLHRVYDHAQVPAGRLRVLVDRLWPRGMRREALSYDAWPKDLAPSPELRRWFGHRPERWAEFHRRYAAELQDEAQQQAMAALLRDAAGRPITLLYGAKDPEHNHALVLREALLHAAH